jgi:Spy/CpxP family protein refolding chaperone
MKKSVTAAALITAVTFAGIQAAAASEDRYFNESRDSKGEDLAAPEKFCDDIKEIRKKIVITRSGLNALMRGENPDETKVAQLTGELYDLESELDSKAGVAEIANRFAC